MTESKRRVTLRTRTVLATLGIVALLTLAGGLLVLQGQARSERALRATLAAHQIEPLALNVPTNTLKIELGRLLFFDKELSGNRDISCATCHHPTLASADARPLSSGVGGFGLGANRLVGGGRPLVPRNATEIFNRGATQWQWMFWDGRVTNDPRLTGGVHRISTPAGDVLPDGIDGLLAAQAMFPVMSRAEMRGVRYEQDINGDWNELGMLQDDDFEGVWDGLLARLLRIPLYRGLFAAVYPDVPTDQLGFEHAANAIAAFEIAAFSFDTSPWDRYVAGEADALTRQQKRGAALFYGAAQCVACHSGPLLTDQAFHNIGVPQFGPGKGSAYGIDFGRFQETIDPADRFAFRTPPLANVAVTGPYMHNGAYASLETAVRHHLDAAAMLRNYDATRELPYSISTTYQKEDKLDTYILATLDPLIADPPTLSERQIGDLVAFLEALTAPGARDLLHLIPDSVPSGLDLRD